MSYEEYKKTGARSPYTLVIKSGENYLYYFGEAHTGDSNHPQWAKWKEFWNEFLAKTVGKKRIVFVEGNSVNVYPTEEEAVAAASGMGLVALHASQSNIEIYSPEPSREEELGGLEKDYAKSLINYYYIARQAEQWGRRGGPKLGFEEYMAPYFRYYSATLEEIKATHKELFKSDFDEGATQFFHEIVDPIFPERTIINMISQKVSGIRDEHIVNKICEYMKKGYSVFGQYGHTHVVVQEPLLRETLE